MPLQNRVTPFGELISTPGRGLLMGNRGSLHDDQKRIRRDYQLIRWIICVLQFKDRHRSVMTPGQYTELFFLDEATALAAGHRPCAECQRERFNLFRRVFVEANSEFQRFDRVLAPMIDERLHAERLIAGGGKRTFTASVDKLPDGCFVAEGDDAYIVRHGRLRKWTPFGYDLDVSRTGSKTVRVLTPRSIVRILKAGYPVQNHPSIEQFEE